MRFSPLSARSVRHTSPAFRVNSDIFPIEPASSSRRGIEAELDSGQSATTKPLISSGASQKIGERVGARRQRERAASPGRLPLTPHLGGGDRTRKTASSMQKRPASQSCDGQRQTVQLRLYFDGGVSNDYRLRENRVEFRVNKGPWRVLGRFQCQASLSFQHCSGEVAAPPLARCQSASSAF